jgi:hypothetical protein
MGLGGAQPADPQATLLVQAAAEGNVSELERLVADGADLERHGSMKPPTRGRPGEMALAARMQFPVTPLLAAVINKQKETAARLIAWGADVNAQHPLFATPLHAAASAGAPEFVSLLLGAGANPAARNPQGQTPLQAIQAVRKAMGGLDALRGLAGSVAKQVEKQLQQIAPMAGWEDCERLLRDHGG